MERVVLSLGSNLGDRLESLRAALGMLATVLDEMVVSAVYETAPVGYQDQSPFLNAVVAGRTALDPAALLSRIASVEAELGRERTVPGGPRTLDIDIIFFGTRIVREEGLIIPHPRWSERAFVLAPLAEILPDLVDPESGRTVNGIWLERMHDTEEIRVFAPASSLEE